MKYKYVWNSKEFKYDRIEVDEKAGGTSTSSSSSSPYTSYSDYWSSRFSSYSRYDSDKEAKKSAALNSIGKTVYVLGTDENFKLRFGDHDVFTDSDYCDKTNFLGNVITFDEKILDTGTEGTYTDILCGDALLKVACRNIVPKSRRKGVLEWIRLQEDTRRVTILKGLIASRASSYIEEKTPGFVPYLAARSNYFGSKLAEDIFDTPKSRCTAVAAMSARLVTPETVSTYGAYEEDIDFLEKTLKTFKDSISPAEEAIYNYLVEKYPEDSIPKSAQADQDDGDTGDFRPGGNLLKEIFGNLFGGNKISAKTSEDEISNDDDLLPEEKRLKLDPGSFKVEDNLSSIKNFPIENKPKSGYYPNYVSRNRLAIAAVKSGIQLETVSQTMLHKGLRSGMLDDGSLEKLTLTEDTLFERFEEFEKPKISVNLLVDLSGSMCSPVRSGSYETRVEAARDVAITLYEALKDNAQIQMGVYGHSGASMCQVYRFVTPLLIGNESSMGTMEAENDNYDGNAIKLVAEDSLKWINPNNIANYLFVISDGQPAGYGYGGTKAEDHVKACSDEAETLGIKTYGIGIANAYSSKTGERMYGKDRFVVISDVKSSTRIISSFISRVLNSL